MKQTLLIFIALCIAMISFSQEIEKKSDLLRKDALNVYMSANDYIRKEIPYVNYVRDIKDAGVYIISTSQYNGSGGREYTYYLTGQHEFEGMNDTITYSTNPDETTDQVRQKQVNCLQMGLIPYIKKTPLAQYIRISFSEPLTETVSTDKWNNWIFRTSLNTYVNGQKTIKSKEFYGSFSANHITEKWKIEIDAYFENDITKYDSEFLSYTAKDESNGFNSRIVRSISNHWSYGGSAGISSSNYSNYKSLISVSPGIEYDLFPYSESTRRQLRILYQIGYNNANYIDTTNFFKIKEELYVHSLTSAYQVIQKWGSVNISMRYRNYLHDWSLNNIYLYGSLSYRIAKGLSLNLSANYSIIHDQINIPKGDLSVEEILTRRKQQQTTYSYYFMIGFSYTFGSIYNNVVNPRFGN